MLPRAAAGASICSLWEARSQPTMDRHALLHGQVWRGLFCTGPRTPGTKIRGRPKRPPEQLLLTAFTTGLSGTLAVIGEVAVALLTAV